MTLSLSSVYGHFGKLQRKTKSSGAGCEGKVNSLCEKWRDLGFRGSAYRVMRMLKALMSMWESFCFEENQVIVFLRSILSRAQHVAYMTNHYGYANGC